MEILKAVAEVENLIKKILSDRKAEENGLQEQLDYEEANHAKASVAMQKAAEAGDVNAYQNAKKERLESMFAAEHYADRLEELQKQPLISKDSYEQAVKSIYAAIDAREDQTRGKLAKLAEQMKAEADKLNEAVIYANKVLHALQHDVYKDADRRRNPYGEIIPITQEEKRADTWETLSWGAAGVDHYQYKKFIGGKEK